MKKMPKNVQTTAQLQSFHMLAKYCSESSMPGFNSTWIENFPDVQVGFRKGRGTRDQLPTFIGSQKKQEISKKKSTSALLTMLKPLILWITTNCGKFFKRWEYQTTWPASCETCMQVKLQQLEPDMEQWTGSKLGKEYVKAVCCHPAYLTYMQSTSCEMPG